MRARTFPWALGALALAVGACRTPAPEAGLASSAGAPAPSGGLAQCVGIHGNGEKIFAHFEPLARLIETYGLMDGIAGGSSASYTTFLYDSIATSPLVWECAGASCGSDQAAQRAALLLKSVNAYVSGTSERSLPGAVLALSQALAQLQLDLKAQGLKAKAKAAKSTAELIQAAAKVEAELAASKVPALVNGAVFARVKAAAKSGASGRVKAAVDDLVASLKGFGSFDTTDVSILLREGPVSFAEVAKRIGTVGDFYALRYEDPAFRGAFQQFVDDCAPLQAGRNWSEIAAGAPQAAGPSCATLFNNILDKYQLLTAQPTAPRSADRITRHTAPSGFSGTPFVATSVVRGASIAAVRAAKARFLTEGASALSVSFSDVGFGYWGDKDAFQKMIAARRPGDFRLQRAVWLGDGSWLEAMTASPAEPGLAPLLDLAPAPATGETLVSAGGWSDLHPAVTLRRAGCDRVFLITRPGPAQFALGVAKLLGATPADVQALFAFDDPASALTQNLLEADAAVCVDWDAPEFGRTLEGIRALSDAAYQAPIAIAGPDAAIGAALAARAGGWPRLDAKTVGCRAR